MAFERLIWRLRVESPERLWAQSYQEVERKGEAGPGDREEDDLSDGQQQCWNLSGGRLQKQEQSWGCADDREAKSAAAQGPLE